MHSALSVSVRSTCSRVQMSSPSRRRLERRRRVAAALPLVARRPCGAA